MRRSSALTVGFQGQSLPLVQSPDSSAGLGTSAGLGLRCGGTFAAACCIQSIRMVLGAATELDWGVHQIDVGAAFLHADAQEEVYALTIPVYKHTGP